MNVLIKLTIQEAEAVQYAAMTKCEDWRRHALLSPHNARAKEEWIALAQAAQKIGEARIKTMDRMDRRMERTDTHENPPPAR